MGKRRRPRPVGPIAIWDDKDQWALLALLDFCIKYPQEFPFGEENVNRHLRAAGSSHDGYTWAQIRRKLDLLYNNFGRVDSRTKNDLYTEGSACLDSLLEQEQSTVNLNVERLEKILKPVRRLVIPHRSVPILSPYQSGLKGKGMKALVTRETSDSPLTLNGGQSRTPDCNMSSGEHLTPRAQRHQTRELAKESKRWESPKESICKNETRRKRTRWSKKGVSVKQQLQNFGRKKLTICGLTGSLRLGITKKASKALAIL